MYYAELLAKHLTAQNFGFCTVDEFKAISADETKTARQINIDMEQPLKGKIDGVDIVQFGIYVKDNDAKRARQTISDIENHLNRKLAFRVEEDTPEFHYTKIITKPSFWGDTPANNFIYSMRVQSLILNT